MRWNIDKTFHFEAGHRVWSQQLNNPDLSISTECSCRHLHGHSYELKVFLTSDFLDQSSMVTDFKNLNFVKEFLDSNLDHKFMIDINDPNFAIITGVSLEVDDDVIRPEFASVREGTNFQNLGKIFPSDSPATQLHRDSFVLVNFVPTSENICRYLEGVFQDKLRNVATITAIELWETKKSHCRYES